MRRQRLAVAVSMIACRSAASAARPVAGSKSVDDERAARP